MRIEIIRCDKCKDAINGPQLYHVVAPYVDWDLCKNCYTCLVGWVDEGEAA